MPSITRALDFAGYPALSDLSTQPIRDLCHRLEGEQREFLEKEADFRSASYRWPRDPLHTWSRIWEYPFVFHHLDRIKRENGAAALLSVADIGSGVTFFPFSAARLGYAVTCVDIDPVCAQDIPAAALVVNHAPGEVGVQLIQNGRFPLADGSQDVVFCISVLEHIPDLKSTIDEMARVLKPNGRLILTFDVDLRGDSELGVDSFNSLQQQLDLQFSSDIPTRAIHPSALLTSANSPYPFLHQSVLRVAKSTIKHLFLTSPFAWRPRVSLYLTVYATVLRKRASALQAN